MVFGTTKYWTERRHAHDPGERSQQRFVIEQLFTRPANRSLNTVYERYGNKQK